MPDAPLIILSGQLSAGKSTLAEAIARGAAHGVHIDVDGIREMVLGGRASPLEWTDETTRQFDLAIEGAVALGAVYQRAGFTVVIEGGLDPAAVQGVVEAADLGSSMVGISLQPPLDVALRRNRERTHKGFDTSILDPVIEAIDAEMRDVPLPDGWHRIDNSGESVEESVARILALLPTEVRADPG